MDEDSAGAWAARMEQFTFGKLFKTFRHRNIKTKYDVEPEWRKPAERLGTGYQPRNYS
jgi:hypothetical protein